MLREDRALSQAEFIAFDLETTGLYAGSCQIVEVAAVRFRGDGAELGRLTRLVDPQRPIPWVAERVHGITDEMVRGQPTIDQVLPEFLEFLGADDALLLAHNASFDLGFLSADLARVGLAAPRHAVLDTLTAARRRLPRLMNHRLATVAAFLQVEGGKHRALADSLTVKDCFLRMLAVPPVMNECGALRHLGPLRYFRDARPTKREADEGDLLERAIARRQRITIVYDGGTKGAARRSITPKKIIRTRGVSYLVAYCHVDAIDKHYRLDRIRELHTTDPK